MRPREAPRFVPAGVTVADAAREAVRSGHTRLPVVDADRGLKAPVGLIHAHDLLAATLDDEMMDVRPLLRPLARLPRQTLVTGLLKNMRDERRHMVLVADERERMVGLLTLEDLVEELVGEIESDTELPPPTHLDRVISARAQRSVRPGPWRAVRVM